MPGPLSANIDFRKIDWLKALNAGSSTIPAFGLVQVTASDANGILSVAQPGADNVDCCINGPWPIAASTYGVVTRHDPFFAVYDPSSGTPAAGQTWGAANGSYLLTANKFGFLTLGAGGTVAVANYQSRVMVARQGGGAGSGKWSMFPAKITSGNNPYSFAEQAPSAGGGWFNLAGGRTGSNAYEFGGNTTVCLNSAAPVVPMWTDGTNYRFEGGQTTTLSIGPATRP